jgi:hypothetical protein
MPTVGQLTNGTVWTATLSRKISGAAVSLPHSKCRDGATSKRSFAMGKLNIVTIHGLVPVPAMNDAPACTDTNGRPSMTNDANEALLAWYRHGAADRMPTNDEIAPASPEIDGPELGVAGQVGFATGH